MHTKLPTLVALLLLTASAHAQIAITQGALTYGQNFDTLIQTTTAETWTNNQSSVSANDAPRLIGLAGWYVGSFGTTATTPQIRGGTGSGTAGSFYSFGAADSSDRALGTLPTDGTASASMRIGVQFVNNTGNVITGFDFTYDGEQWREASISTATNNQFAVAYAVFNSGEGSLGASGFTSINSATFNTPVDGGDSSSSALDGNAPENRETNLLGSISGLTVAPGQEIWIRWFDSNSSGADHGIAIDNFAISFAAIPEPSAFAALAGFAALGLVATRRRRA